MKLLFDQGTPAPLRGFLSGHSVSTAYEQGWHTLKNGELLARAHANGFDAIVTTDQNLRYQQNLTGRPAVVVLMTTNWPRIRAAVARVVDAVSMIGPDTYVEIEFPDL